MSGFINTPKMCLSPLDSTAEPLTPQNRSEDGLVAQNFPVYIANQWGLANNLKRTYREYELVWYRYGQGDLTSFDASQTTGRSQQLSYSR